VEIGQGEWEGRTHDEITRRWPAELAAWRRRPHEAWAPGGESIAEVRARVRPALAEVLERLGRDYPRGSLDRPQVGGYAGAVPEAGQPWSVVVGHDGVFKVLLLTLFGLPLDRFWMFTFALCGITIVELRGGRAVLRAHNLTEHLAPLLDEQAQAEVERRARSGAL
jgi:broad specificity phosphatase PhoE